VVEGFAGAAFVSRRFDPVQDLYVDGVNPGSTRSDLLNALMPTEALTFTALRPGQADVRLAE
jgi:hypothetical protein